MKKNFKYYLMSWIILVAIFNVIVFVLPNEWYGFNKFGGAFWGAYIFMMLAFVGQLACAYKAFQANNATKFFYNIPLISVSYYSLVIMAVSSVICFVIPDLPNWVAVIIGAIILGFSAITIVKASAAADIVSNIDEKIKVKTFAIKSLTVEANTLMKQAGNEELKGYVKKAYEALRYADPMSCEALEEDEMKICKKFNELSEAVMSSDNEVAKAVVDDFVVLVTARNNKCKLLK